MKKPIKKPDPPKPPEPQMHPEARAEFEKNWPNLYAHIFDAAYEDGTKRVGSSLVMFSERGLLKVALNDNEAGLVAFVCASHFLEALERLEQGLLDETLDWRKKRPNYR